MEAEEVSQSQGMLRLGFYKDASLHPYVLFYEKSRLDITRHVEGIDVQAECRAVLSRPLASRSVAADRDDICEVFPVCMLSADGRPAGAFNDTVSPRRNITRFWCVGKCLRSSHLPEDPRFFIYLYDDALPPQNAPALSATVIMVNAVKYQHRQCRGSRYMPGAQCLLSECGGLHV